MRRRTPCHPATANQRGSVLITALILSAIIAISLSSYIRLAINSLNLADRSFYQNSAINLTEVGIEEAMYCYNQLDSVATPTAAWPSPWIIASDNSVSRTITGFAPGPGVSAQIKVYCSAYNPASASNPVIVAKSIVTFAKGGPAITKFMEVTLRKRSLFVNGLVAKEGITWVGHPVADSWNSDPDNNPATNTPYSAAAQAANCTVGALTGNISLGSGGDIFGYAKTGPGGVTAGGSVHGLGSTTNDPARISSDFSANFPAITTPTPTTVNTIANYTPVPTEFPLASDQVNAADGKYYYNFGSGKMISDTTTIGDSIANKNVVILLNNHQNVESIGFSGTKSLTVKTGSTLTIYTNGNITATGNGMVNGNTAGANPTSSLLIYGTSIAPTTQEIKIGGNGQLYAAIYAPQANVELKGGGSSGMVLGSVVAKTITMNGGTDFHYDEALANVGTGNPFGIIKWRELQSESERAAYATQLNF